MLKVRILDSVSPSGKSVMLCDHAGNPLPQQVSTSLTQDGPDDCAYITVTIRIDGKQVQFAD